MRIHGRQRHAGFFGTIGALAAVLMPSSALGVTALPRDAALVIYFADESGDARPYLFYEGDVPFQMSMCEPRLDYLTKMFYRSTRSNPEFDGLTAVKSGCMRIDGFANGGAPGWAK